MYYISSCIFNFPRPFSASEWLINFLKLCEQLCEQAWQYRKGFLTKVSLILDQLLFDILVSVSYPFQGKLLVCSSLQGISESAAQWCGRDLRKLNQGLLLISDGMKYEMNSPCPFCAWTAWLLLLPMLPRTFSGLIFRMNELHLSIHLVDQIGKWVRFWSDFNLHPQSLFLFQISTADSWHLCNMTFFLWSSGPLPPPLPGKVSDCFACLALSRAQTSGFDEQGPNPPLPTHLFLGLTAFPKM